MDFTSIEDALLAWLRRATDLPATSVILAAPGIPQPARPYATLRLDGPRQLGRDTQSQEQNLLAPRGQEIALTSSGPRELTCSVQVFAAPTSGNASAKAILSRAQASLGGENILAALSAVGLAVYDRGNVHELPEIIGGVWQSRAVMDVGLRVTDSFTEKLGYIETVELTPTLDCVEDPKLVIPIEPP